MKIVLFPLLLFFCLLSYAQDFGGFPPTTRWKQINTDTARIIFDAATTDQAQRIATIIHKMAAEKPVSIGSELKKINIVLHKNTTLSNGYVSLAPFRSEFYLIPSSNVFDLGSLPWSEHLAIHEYRHVQQYNNFNRGLAKAFRFVLGEEGQALANATTIPNWFFEGDAVHSETALTPQGRGRLPYFLSGYNSLWTSVKNYSLMKLLNGSLKDYVPDHYQFGYLVTNYGYQQYGADFWRKTTADAAAFKGLFYPFRKSIKRHSGVSYKQFISAAFNNGKKEIQTDETKTKSEKEIVTNYHFPKPIGNDSLLYLKDSYGMLPAFYVQDKNGEHRIKLKNIGSEDWFSYRNGIIAYTAYNTNTRWSLTDFSEIILLDIKSGKERRLTQRTKYFTPGIAPSGNRIVAVAMNDSVQSELHLLDMDGTVQKRFLASRGNLFLHPKFIDENNIVVAIRESAGSIALHQMNLETGITEQLTATSFSVIGYPSVHADRVYFSAAYNGNDDLYVLNLADKKIVQLTSEQTGNYYPQIVNDSLVWSQFTAEGLRLRKASINDLQHKEINVLRQQTTPYPVAEATANLLATPTKYFPVQTYKKGAGLFNFHSWRPYYEDPEFSFTLYGNNILSTFSSEVFYRYNQNEKSHGAGLNLAYGALFPVLNAGGEYTLNRHVTIRTPQGLRAGLLNAYEFNAGYYIPLNFSHGKTYKFLTFGTNYVFSQQMPAGATKNILASFNSMYLHHFLNWQQQLPRAAQQIYPKLGYAISSASRHRTDESGFQSIVNGNIYLPSIKNHSIVLSGSYQEVDTSNVLFSNRFTNSRGYPDDYYSRMWRASANYHFPIAYPDWGFGGLLYFLRIRANVFYDFTRLYANNKTSTADLRSAGAELFFDTKWWNQAPVTIGVRYSYLVDADKLGLKRQHAFEIIIPTSLIPD